MRTHAATAFRLLLPTLLFFALVTTASAKQPNFIIILTDDVGYSDIGCFGGTRAKTPNLDLMAKQGMRFTDFYAHPVCGVTRAALMTGSYAMRAAEVGNKKNGHPILHPQEITIAEVMRDAGYQTGMIGKWHLAGGRREAYPPELMPNAQGFDYYFGAPLHNGFTRKIEQSKFRMQLMRQNEIIDNSIDQKEMDQVTNLYTKEAVQFIKQHKEKPFFLYVAHSMAHVVIGASENFRGKSAGGLYGDVIEELDWSTGEILKTLKETGVDENTFVIFMSDNGPWVEGHLAGEGGNDTHYGTASPLRGAKMMTWEGGVRVPTIVRWPATVPAGSVNKQPATIMDLLPTFAKLGGGKLPNDRVIDGKDISPLLRGEPSAESPHEAIFHYSFVHLQAVRSGKWKLVLPRPAKPKWTLWSARLIDAVDELSLYDLEADLGETTNVAKQNPDEVARLLKLVEKGREEIGDYNVIGKGARFFDDAPKRTESRGWINGEVDPKPRPTKAVANKYDNFKPVGKLRFDFESGDLQGWKVVEGKFDLLISDRKSLPKWKHRPYNREGKYHLSTVAIKGAATASDKMTGVLESPRFKLTGPRMSFLIGGGDRQDVYIALCDEEGKVLLQTGGGKGPQMVRRHWDTSKYVGQTAFLRIVDQAQSGWGHITFDDFSAEAECPEGTCR